MLHFIIKLIGSQTTGYLGIDDEGLYEDRNAISISGVAKPSGRLSINGNPCDENGLKRGPMNRSCRRHR